MSDEFGVCTADSAHSQHKLHLLPLAKQGKGKHRTERDLLRGSNLRGKAEFSSPGFRSDRSLRETLIADPGPTALLCPGGVPHSQPSQWECRQGARMGYSLVSMLFLKTNKPTKLNLSNKNGSNSISLNAEVKKIFKKPVRVAGLKSGVG